MIVRTALAATASLSFLVGAAGVSAEPTRIDLGAATLYAQPDPRAMLAGIELHVGAGLDRQTLRQNGLAALCAEIVLSTPSSGGRLRDVIAAHGGSLSYSIGPQYTRFYLEAPPASMDGFAKMVAKALAAPDYSAATLQAARAALAARISDDQNNPVAVGSAMLRESFYEGGAGLPTDGTTATLAAFTADDARAFLAAYYRRGTAKLTAVGNVTPTVTDSAKVLVSALADGDVPAVETKTRAFTASPKRIVAQRDIGVPYLMLGFPAPSVGDPDFGAMLVLRSLLSEAFDRPSATTLPIYARSVGVLYNYDTKPASLAVYINGQQTEPTAGLASVDQVIRELSDKPLTAPLLSRYKTSAHGQWQTEGVALADQAWSLTTYAEQGVDPNYASTALSAIDATTAADVQRVAKNYLQKFTVALIIPREKAPSTP